MRILLTADPTLPVPPPLYGGIERIVHGIINELRLRGHQVGLIAHAESTSEVDFFTAWPSVTYGGLGGVGKFAMLLRSTVKSFRPDVVHSFSRLMLLLAIADLRIPRLMSYQRDTGGWRNSMAAAIGGKSFAFTACSEYIAGRGRPAGGRWLAIPNFTDVGSYTFNADVPDDAPLVFLSRVEAIKGAHVAIQIARLAKRRLIIAGNRVDTPQGAAYWEREIAPNIGRDGIEYVGAVNDAQKDVLLGKAAAMLVPIQWDEPFGIVFAEALACGTPVIACPRGALPEIVRDGENGFLINSVEEGAAAVQRLAQIDRRLCRHIAETRYSQSAVVDAYLALYGELLSGMGR